MKYQWTVILLGFLTIVFPFLHLPLSWEVVLQVVLGIMLILTGLAIHQSRTPKKKANPTSTPTTKPTHYVEVPPSTSRDASAVDEHHDGEILS